MMNESTTPVPIAPVFVNTDQHLFEARAVFVSGSVTAELALRVTRELLALERANPEAAITLWINSPGGEVYSGFSIYDTIQIIKPKVITVVAGSASSMGATIALAAEKQYRVMTPNSKFLLHQPLYGGTVHGSASELEIHANDIVALKRRMHELYASRTGQPIEKFEELMDRDRWVYAGEALELGLVSRVIKSQSELEELRLA